MKKGSWCRDLGFGSFSYKGEEITIDTEDKYLYWAEKLDGLNHDKDIQDMLINDFLNFGRLWEALENFLYITHRIDDHNWDK